MCHMGAQHSILELCRGRHIRTCTFSFYDTTDWPPDRPMAVYSTLRCHWTKQYYEYVLRAFTFHVVGFMIIYMSLESDVPKTIHAYIVCIVLCIYSDTLKYYKAPPHTHTNVIILVDLYKWAKTAVPVAQKYGSAQSLINCGTPISFASDCSGIFLQTAPITQPQIWQHRMQPTHASM